MRFRRQGSKGASRWSLRAEAARKVAPEYRYRLRDLVDSQAIPPRQKSPAAQANHIGLRPVSSMKTSRAGSIRANGRFAIVLRWRLMSEAIPARVPTGVFFDRDADPAKRSGLIIMVSASIIARPKGDRTRPEATSNFLVLFVLEKASTAPSWRTR